MEFTWNKEDALIKMIFTNESGREGQVKYSVQGDNMELWNEGFPGKSQFSRQ